MTALAHPHRCPGTVLFAYGFRPFFLLAGLYAAFGIAAWSAALALGLPLPASASPAVWHGHEMLFGFAAAAAAGFLLTAVPSWTGTEPRHGLPLALAVVLWLAGRVAMWAGGAIPPWTAAVVDLAFLPALAVLLAGPLVRARKGRNLVFLVLLAVLFVANLLVHLEMMGLADDTAEIGLRLATYVFVLMILVIGGRIAPRFTANALAQRGIEAEVRPVPLAEKAGLIGAVLTAAADLAGAPLPLTGALALVTAAALFWRMRHWQTRHVLDQPILWVLHLAHAWVPVGFACLAAADLGGVLSADSALHAFTAGAIGTAILAVMTRAGLGHTGRPLTAPPLIVAAYVLVTLAACVRVFGPLAGDYYLDSLALSGILWVGAFGLFSGVFAPILLAPRPDGRPG